MRLSALFTIVFVGCLAAATQAPGSIILSETWTGEELYNESLNDDPRVTFPSRTPSLQGMSLFFNTGTNRFEKLLVLALLPQNSLNPADPAIVHIFANFTAQRSTWPTDPTDHDPGIGVGDGTVFGGIIAADNAGGEADAILYRDAGYFGQGIGYYQLFTGAGYPAVGQSFTVESAITLTTAFAEMYGAFGSKSASHAFTTALDLNAPLSFVFFAHDDEERYKLNWVSIEVQGTPAAAVPEPSSLVLFSALGVMGLGLAWRRKQRCVLRSTLERGDRYV